MKITIIFDDGITGITGEVNISMQQLAKLEKDAIQPFFMQIGEQLYRQVLKKYLGECQNIIQGLRKAATAADLPAGDREILTKMYEELKQSAEPDKNQNEGEGS